MLFICELLWGYELLGLSARALDVRNNVIKPRTKQCPERAKIHSPTHRVG